MTATIAREIYKNKYINRKKRKPKRLPLPFCNKNMFLFVRFENNASWLITEARTIHPGLPD